MPVAAQLFDLTGQVAMVTGASSGLGWRFAQVLARQGANVVLAARRVERLEKLKAEIEADGGKAVCVALDVADSAAISAAFDRAETAFGPVTIQVNNAGMAIQKPALEISGQDWRALMDVNLDAVWCCSQEAAKRMIAANKSGCIINISSVLSFRAMPGFAAYSIAKAAISQMTKSLAVEFARHKIRVNAIAPGYIRTQINQQVLESAIGDRLKKSIPQRRFGEPGDLDGTVLLLASEKAAGFMTGEVVVVDGGHSVVI